MRDQFTPRSTRDIILDATDRALATVGYKKMKIEDLAREAGIGKGSIYLHFESKEDIVISHIDRVISRILDELNRINAEAGPASERIRQMLITRVMERFEAVQIYTQILNEKLASIRVRLLERRIHHFRLEAEILAKTIDSGTKAGEFLVEEPMPIARSLLDATNSLLPFSLSLADISDREEVRRRTERLADLLIAGLRYRCQ